MSYIYSISTPDDDAMDDLRRAYEVFGGGFDYDALVSWARDNSDGDGWGTFFNVFSPTSSTFQTAPTVLTISVPYTRAYPCKRGFLPRRASCWS